MVTGDWGLEQSLNSNIGCKWARCCRAVLASTRSFDVAGWRTTSIQYSASCHAVSVVHVVPLHDMMIYGTNPAFFKKKKVALDGDQLNPTAQLRLKIRTKRNHCAKHQSPRLPPTPHHRDSDASTHAVCPPQKKNKKLPGDDLW